MPLIRHALHGRKTSDFVERASNHDLLGSISSNIVHVKGKERFIHSFIEPVSRTSPLGKIFSMKNSPSFHGFSLLYTELQRALSQKEEVNLS